MECWSKPPSSVIKIHLATRVWLIVMNMPNQSEEVLNRQSQILTLQVDWLDKI